MARHKTSANYDMPTVPLWQNADILQQRRRRNTNVGATSAADRDDADQCRRWANVAMLAGICVTKDMRTGGRLNKKDGLTRYGDSHVKDKTS